MSTGTATTQGYVLSNDFSPTLNTNSTVHAGNNISSTCGTGNFTNDLCSGTTKGCSEASGSGGKIAVCPAITVNARGTTFDAGAYQFNAATNFTLTVTVTGSGSVSDSQGGIVACTASGGTCSASYASGTNDTLTETPGGGFTFSTWGGGCSGSSSTCSITLSANTSVTALFLVKPTLTVTVMGVGSVSDSQGGIVNCTASGGTCSATYVNGTVDTLTESTTLPYMNGGFSAPCPVTVELAQPCTLTLTANTSVTASFVHAQLPTTWVNNLEYIAQTSNVVLFPGAWICNLTTTYPSVGSYPNTQAGLQSAVNDAETCRFNTNTGTTIVIPFGTLYSGANGITLPQTAVGSVSDTSTKFIVLTSSRPLLLGRTACSHGVQDNVLESSQPGVRNLGCVGSNVSYQLGTTITTVSGPFTLANGTITNTSAYNDVSSMYTIECTANNCNAIQTATWDANKNGPHHFAILNAELRPQAGLVGSAAPFAIGQNTETQASELPSHIHLAYSYLHGDWADAPMTGCPSACVATGPPTGANSLPSMIAFNGCVYCSVSYSYTDQAIRPGSEGHVVSALLAQQTKYVHNWFEGMAIGKLCGGFSNAITLVNFVTCQDEEDRGNRYTYPYSWMLAENVPIIRQITQNGAGGTGTGYVVNDVITVVQAGASGGTGTVTATGAGGTITAVTVLSPGTGYFPASGLSVTGGSGTGGTVNIGTGYFPNGSVTNGYTRKNAHEYKFGERILEDGNIYENTTNAGAQNGTLFSHKTAQTSSGVLSTNYWTTLDSVTVTNIVARNGCNGPSAGDRSDAGGGNGGGTSHPNQTFYGANWLIYNASVFFLGNPNSNLTSNACAGATPQYGLRIGSSVPGNIWSATVSFSSGQTTATLTSAPGLGVSNINIGDPVTVTGCSDATFDVGNAVMGPPALFGTLPNGLTVVYANPGADSNGSGVTGCTLSSAQGWPNQYAFNHVTIIDDPASTNNPSNSANGGTNIFPLARQFTITNSILINGGLNSTAGAGTRTSTRMYDPVSMQFNNTLMPGIDGSVTCPGHTSPAAGGMVACYTEYTNAYVAVTPATLYGVPPANCTGSDPITGACAGILAGMSTSSFPIIVNDFHQFRPCHISDGATCNNKASLYSAGQANQATDGTDLGVSTAQLDAAQTSILYVCQTPCGSGPFVDVNAVVPAPYPPAFLGYSIDQKPIAEDTFLSYSLKGNNP
jgi:hypothetical protein